LKENILKLIKQKLSGVSLEIFLSWSYV